MTTPIHVSPGLFKVDGCSGAAISFICERFVSRATDLIEEADAGQDARQLELHSWQVVMEIGALILCLALAVRCRRAALRFVESSGLAPGAWRFRHDRNYVAKITTTLGTLPVPMFAIRQKTAVGSSMNSTPFSEVFPLHPKCRSSELCLQWETKLAINAPFREAQKDLSFFTHGAVTLEDTTIARHAYAIGAQLGRDWFYKTPDDIADILRDRATRDTATGRPLLYVSGDAHALRRYVDDGWTPQWKMLNGLRLWCVDKESGQIIHLGGEFTWGDADYVRNVFRDLIAKGILPSDGRYRDDVRAQIVFIADGMPWLDTLLEMLTDAVAILDYYHLQQRLCAYLKTRRNIYFELTRREAIEVMLGKNPNPHQPPVRRKGHRKRKRGGDRPGPKGSAETQPQDPAETEPMIWRLLQVLFRGAQGLGVHEKALLKYLVPRADRIDYRALRRRGYQIGSGAMESIHRTGSQLRMKRPGATWLPETSQAVVNLRMLHLAGRWDEFWERGWSPEAGNRFAAPANTGAGGQG